MKKAIQFLFLIISITFASCENVFELPEYEETATNIENLNVSEDFDWKTSNKVVVEITGLPAMKNINPVKNTLTLSDGVNAYYTGYHSISENQRIELIISSEVKNIKLQFGSIEKEALITNGKVSFSFIPEN
jgi:hypothetical protein